MSASSHMRFDYLENAAKAFARNKATDVGGELVCLVLDRTNASLPEINAIEDAEIHMKHRVEALLKHSLVEFTNMWTAELQRQVEVFHKIAHDALGLSTPTIVVPASGHGEGAGLSSETK